MRDECDDDRLSGGGRELLLDLGQVSMPGETVGPHAFVTFDKKKGEIRLATSATDAAERISDDGGGVNQLLPEEGDQGEQDGSRITTGRGHEGCGGNGPGMDLGQSVNRGIEEIRSGVSFSIEFLVYGGFPQAEVGAQVNYPDSLVEEGSGVFSSGSMREGKKGNGRSTGGNGLHVWLNKGQLAPRKLGESGKYPVNPSSGIGTGRGGGDLRCGVSQEESDELHPGIAAGAQDGYLDGFHGELVDMAGKSRLANAECHGLHTDRLPAPLFNTIIGT